MIKLAISGGATIYSISPVQEIPSKTGGNPFQKREVILDDSWTSRDGVLHPNFVAVEFTGDKMPMLDNFQPGQRVTIDACVNGREHNGRVFTSIRGLGIYPYQEQPQQGYAPQPVYQQQAAYPQPQPAYRQPAYPQPAAPQPAQQLAYPQQASPQPAPYPSPTPSPGNTSAPF